MAEKETHIFTVTEVTKYIRTTLETQFPEVWIEGEVSNLRAPASGHFYFSLKDENSMIKCVIFRSANSRLNFALEDGMNVICFGRISVYDKQGQYQLYVDSIEPKGKGALYVAFEQLKKKLRTEGLFDEEYKKDIPFLPLRVGVVTSGTGAAIRDILKVARRRFSNIQMTICPVRVQGDEAKFEIAEAIERLNEYNEYLAETGSEEHPIDVMIVGRGGGSIEDLWAFNEEMVARAIFDSRIPVISAVGHEIDYTISDFVADCRAATPSHAAEMILPEKSDLEIQISSFKDRISSSIMAKFIREKERLEKLSNSYVLRDPKNVLLNLEQEIDDVSRRMYLSMQHCIDLSKRSFGSVHGKLCVLNPESILNRGYSITFKNGKVIKDPKVLKKGDLVKTRLAQGEIASRVEKT